MEYISCKIFSEGMYIIILFEGPDLSQLDGPIAPNWASLLKDPTLDVESYLLSVVQVHTTKYEHTASLQRTALDSSPPKATLIIWNIMFASQSHEVNQPFWFHKHMQILLPYDLWGIHASNCVLYTFLSYYKVHIYISITWSILKVSV